MLEKVALTEQFNQPKDIKEQWNQYYGSQLRQKMRLLSMNIWCNVEGLKSPQMESLKMHSIH